MFLAMFNANTMKGSTGMAGEPEESLILASAIWLALSVRVEPVEVRPVCMSPANTGALIAQSRPNAIRDVRRLFIDILRMEKLNFKRPTIHSFSR